MFANSIVLLCFAAEQQRLCNIGYADAAIAEGVLEALGGVIGSADAAVADKVN